MVVECGIDVGEVDWRVVEVADDDEITYDYITVWVVVVCTYVDGAVPIDERVDAVGVVVVVVVVAACVGARCG